jgi:hypothetical protein
MNGLLKYNYSEPVSTGVAHDNIDLHINNDYYNKKLQDAQDALTKSDATIGPVVDFGDTELGGSILDIAMGSAMPGTAIGRISNKMLTGGLPAKTLKTFVDQIYHKPSDIINQIKNINKLNSSRLAAEKALNKHGIPHEGRKLMDPVSEILRTSKYKQN